MMFYFPPVPDLETILERLALIYPEGTENRTYCVRESTARTVQVMLYAGALSETDRWIRPSQVTDMTDAQMQLKSDVEREAWCVATLSSKRRARPRDAWYAPNSREQIRDENIRQGLIPNSGAVERAGLPTTSSKPKYALQSEFAALFDPQLAGDELTSHIKVWRDKHMSKAALARLMLVRKGATAGKGRVAVAFPNGEAITLSAGPSSLLTKAVIEDFAARYLHSPAVLWVSESSNKVVDNSLVEALKLKIDPSKNLPDVILVDVGSDDDVLFVFVEVVHSDGPINQLRKTALEAIAVEAGFSTAHLTYVTAFADRDAGPYKTLAPNLAWDSFVWFASEPDAIVCLKSGSEKKLSELR